MKLWQKIMFIVVLVIFVSASVTISLISISRPPYKYKEETAIGADEAMQGCSFASFNGNASTKALYIDFMRDKNGNDPDVSMPVVAVGAYAVNADEYVETLKIGASVQHIEETSFYNLKKLQKVTVDPSNAWYKDIDGILFTRDGKTLLLYPACYGQTPTPEEDVFTYPDAYTVPDGVERIGTFAFLKNEHIRDLTLPASLREIGDMTFFGCARLGAYEYDAETDTLAGKGFALPDGLRKIGTDAFSKCGSIAPVLYIPAGVEEIGHHAFFSCTGMKDVFLGAADEDALTLGESWLPKSIKAGAMWKAPKPQYGKTRADLNELITSYKAEQLEQQREEAQKNG